MISFAGGIKNNWLNKIPQLQMNHFCLKKTFAYIALLCIVLMSYAAAFGQSTDDLVQKCIGEIYHLQFDSARINADLIIRNDPGDPKGYFFDAMIVWWNININKENTSLDGEFFKKADKVIEVADRVLEKNENDQNALFYKGGALGYKGLVYSIRENWFKAAEYGKEALNLLQEAYELDPGNKDVMFGVGLYNYFAEYVPEVYPVVKPLMLIFPKGDKLKGLSQIKETAASAKYAKNEARYVLAYLYLLYEKNYMESEQYSLSLHQEFPENPLFEKYLLNSYVGLGKWQEARSGWLNLIQKIDSGKFGYGSRALAREANYYTALSFLKLGQPLDGEKYVVKAEEITKQADPENESAITAYINLLSGMINDAKGNRSTADMYYDKVLAMKNFQNSHQEAERLKSERFKH